MIGITNEFIREIESLFTKSIPEKVKKKVRSLLLDSTGVTLVGSKALDERLSKFIQFNPLAGVLTIAGLKRKMDMMSAV